MSKTLDLPYEIHSNISAFALQDLSETDIRRNRRAWCQVCRTFRDFYQTELYSSVRLYKTSTPTSMSFFGSPAPFNDDRVPFFLQTIQNSPGLAAKVTSLELGGLSLMVSPNGILSHIPASLPSVKRLSFMTDVHWDWITAVDQAFLKAAIHFWNIEWLALKGFNIPFSHFQHMLQEWAGVQHLFVSDIFFVTEVVPEVSQPVPQVEVTPQETTSVLSWRKRMMSATLKRIGSRSSPSVPSLSPVSASSVSTTPHPNAGGQSLPTRLRSSAHLHCKSLIIYRRQGEEPEVSIDTASILLNLRQHELKQLHIAGPIFRRGLSFDISRFPSLTRLGLDIDPLWTQRETIWLTDVLASRKSGGCALELLVLQQPRKDWHWYSIQVNGREAFRALDAELLRVEIRVQIWKQKKARELPSNYGSPSVDMMWAEMLPRSWASGKVTVHESMSAGGVFDVQGAFWKLAPKPKDNIIAE
ncbi:hypothetical protein DL96DRAFT_21453 [Flagelloscypha sp. PMI_526]|nr:hypothetical protein DL96DRAFT_21453 [Flagelloscypha sp. PMI_526]